MTLASIGREDFKNIFCIILSAYIRVATLKRYSWEHFFVFFINSVRQVTVYDFSLSEGRAASFSYCLRRHC